MMHLALALRAAGFMTVCSLTKYLLKVSMCNGAEHLSSIFVVLVKFSCTALFIYKGKGQLCL